MAGRYEHQTREATHMTPPRLSLAAMLIATFTWIAPPVFAGECMRLCDWDFMEAATMQDIQAEINRGADIRGRDNIGLTPLHTAAAKDNAEAITALIEAGADIEVRSGSGGTPLHWAAYPSSSKAVTALIEAGADIKARTESGRPPPALGGENGRC